VRFVVHAGAPRSLEHYQQESGRAGRDGLEAECILISSSADFMKWRLMLEQNGELSEANRTLLRQMEGYATGVGCRHRHLAGYFGDEYAAPANGGCGACDFCLDELEPVASPVVVARKILSCVARVEQRFGATHVTSVLRGHASEQVVSRGHDKLSTFGLLPQASPSEVRGYIEQLTGLGLLQHSGSEYPVLALTAKGVTLLKDEHAFPDLTLARQRQISRTSPRAKSRAESESWQDVDRSLFDRLRTVRLEIARSRGVPPYVIFHDATLREMARLRPMSLDAMLTVKGVGARKADDLGEAFLAAIRAHQP
jgi:ATP-dependent DNA helicase RecQ